MAHFYADIHCHSTTKPFYTQKGPAEDRLRPRLFRVRPAAQVQDRLKARQPRQGPPPAGLRTSNGAEPPAVPPSAATEAFLYRAFGRHGLFNIICIV